MNEKEEPADTVAVILARMEVKLDHALTRGDDHEARLRVLEKKVWLASGLAALSAGFIATLVENQVSLGG